VFESHKIIFCVLLVIGQKLAGFSSHVIIVFPVLVTELPKSNVKIDIWAALHLEAFRRSKSFLENIQKDIHLENHSRNTESTSGPLEQHRHSLYA
jgi:hypothetical protein